MDKSPEAFRTISEVAEDMDLPQHVLRFWETRFPQIKPLKRGGGRRYYRPDDVDLLRAVKQLLYGEGYTIKGVQKLLREQGAAFVARGLAGREDAETTKAAAAAVETPSAARSAADAGPAASRGDLAALRAVLADLREAERLLSLSRSG
jgi:DNA-binding transcriptional MerR regulator